MTSAFPSPIPPPPSISMPVWSLSCPTQSTGTSAATTTSMNLMTFCTPVSISPKLWALALYHDTLTKESFLQHGIGILQLLTPLQQELVSILGKQSGYEVDKQDACQKVGIIWQPVGSMHILPNCATYLEVEVANQSTCTVEAGDHVVVICQVTRTGQWKNGQLEWLSLEDGPQEPLDSTHTMYTGWLRQQGIL